MAYLFNQQADNSSSTQSTPANPGVNGDQPQAVQTSPQSTFKDPAALTSKNNTVKQEAVNTAVTSGAQKQIESNTAQLNKQATDYTANQQKNFAQNVDAKSDLSTGGNKLESVLKGPSYQADQFQYSGNQGAQAPTNTASYLQNNLAPQRQGTFYSQGMANVDADIYKESGQQAQDQGSINHLNQMFQNQVQNTGNQLQQDLSNQGQQKQQEVQSDIKNQLTGIQSGLKQSDRDDFQNQIKQRQDAQVQGAMAKAKAAGSHVTEDQIRSQLTQYNATDNYASNQNLSQENRINSLLGNETPLSNSIGEMNNDANIQKTIDEGIPQQEATLYDPKKEPGYYGNITAVPNRTLGRLGTDIGGVFSPKTPNMLGTLGNNLAGLFQVRKK